MLGDVRCEWFCLSVRAEPTGNGSVEGPFPIGISLVFPLKEKRSSNCFQAGLFWYMSSALTIMDLALDSNPRDRLRIYTPPTSDVSILQPSTEYQYHFEPQWVAIMPRGVARQPIIISPTPRDVVHRLSPTDFTSHRHCFFPSTDQLDV